MIGIIAAMEDEVNATLMLLETPEVHNYYGIVFHRGKINKLDCVIAKSGVGKVNAARCAQIMIDKFVPEGIINIGSAGALHSGLAIGDLVISTSCIQYDFDITAFGHKKGYISGISERFMRADDKLTTLCMRAMEETLDKRYKIVQGIIASGDQFISSSERKLYIHNEFDAECVEMEGAAIAQVCYLCEIPFVVIRSISDTCEEGNTVDFKQFLVLASKRCSDFINRLTLHL